ncbi:2878_t:CDS:1 [Paraglomus brasilianum]|uniref:2878_t:CDS:1 n=1 Tax=Paraglomus brasilianum TaxID=144538 RepID=A0A9N9B1G8_9GLOM|nr:2878_t:CDS:1 [Paraglomus brasilianum]
MPSAEVSSPLQATNIKQLQLYDIAAQIFEESPQNLPSLPFLPSLPPGHLSPHSPRGHLRVQKRFWQFIIISDTTTYVSYGTIEDGGKLKERATQIKQHLCIENAHEFINNMIEEKIENGYVGWAAW